MKLFAFLITFLAVEVGAQRACPSEGDVWIEEEGMEEEPEFLRECPNGVVEEKFDDCPPDLKEADGHWTEWTTWVKSKFESTGATHVTRERTCTNPPPDKECGGMRCRGQATQIRTCSRDDAEPMDGGWTAWSAWTRVDSARKGGAGMSRMRSCTNPPPDCGGSYCEGIDYQIKPCADCAPPDE